MKRFHRFSHFVALLWLGGLFFSACGEVDGKKARSSVHGENIDLRYASFFDVTEEPYGYRATIFPNGKAQPDSIVYDLYRDDSFRSGDASIAIHVPIRRLGTNSGTLFEFLRLLGVSDRLVATCDSKYVFSDEIRERIAQGDIIPLGSSFDMNAENVLIAHLDVLMLSDWRDDPHTDVCPLVRNLEWKESSVLARAEWVKFFSLFFDEYAKGDSVFSAIEQRYLDLKGMTDTLSVRPTVFSAGNFGDTWYLTGGEGYMSKLYEDAGGTYLLSDTLVPTVTCGIEWLLEHFSGADFWMNCGMGRLQDIDPRLLHMKSVQEGKVFHFEKRKKRVDGMNITDFYETAVARPDVVLADVISVLHPELLPKYKSFYLGRCGEE